MGYETRYKDCHRRVATRILEADLSFLDEDEGKEEVKRNSSIEAPSGLLGAAPSSLDFQDKF